MKRWYLVVAATCVLPAAGQAQEVCRTWALVERQTIGSVDGPVVFTAPLDLDLDPTGNVYVTDLFNPGVQVLSPSGAHLGNIGRAGDGPGGFYRSTPALGWAGDTLWVGDQRALVYFDADRTETRRVSFQAHFPEHGSTLVPGYPLADGSFLGRRTLVGEIERFRLAREVPLLRLGEGGETLDTILVVERPPMIVGEENRFGIPEPLDRHPLYYWSGDSNLPVSVAVDGASVVIVDDLLDEGIAAFEILRVSVSGDTVATARIPYAPEEVSRADRAFLTEAAGAHWAGEYLGSRGRVGSAEAERRKARMRESIWFPDHHPPVREIFAGHDGTVWLLRQAAPMPIDRWEVYDEGLSYLGAIEVDSGRMHPLPWAPRFGLLRATRDELWAYTIDDLEVPYIHRFDIDRGCGG